MPQIRAAGAELVAISPMLGKYAPQLVKKLGLDFPLLSDPGNRYAEQLGAVMNLPAELVEVYSSFGIDLQRFNGDDSWRLPLPGRILVDAGGTVRDVDLYTDHHRRPDPEEGLEKLRSLAG